MSSNEDIQWDELKGSTNTDHGSSSELSGLNEHTAHQITKQLGEVTKMYQESSDELRVTRKQNAQLLEENKALQAKIKQLEQSLTNATAVSSSAEGNSDIAKLQSHLADATSRLTTQENENATLRNKMDDYLQRNDSLESEMIFYKKKCESITTKITQEKDAEINNLKSMFAEVSEKRKESFLQLKERLKQAADVINDLTAKHEADTKRIAELTQHLAEAEQTQKALNEQLSAAKAELTAISATTASSSKKLEEEVQREKQLAEDVKKQLDSLNSELAKANTIIALKEEQEQAGTALDIRVESEGGGLICENSRPLKLIHSYPTHSPVQWYRSFRGGQYSPIPGMLSQKSMYIPTVDDIGACLKVEISLSNGTKGYREVGPVGSNRQMIITIAEGLKKMEAVFNVEGAYEPGLKNKSILLNKEKIKLRHNGKTVAKGIYSEHIKVVLDDENPLKFTVWVEEKTPPISYVAATQKERDLIAQTIRSYNTHSMAGKNAPADHLIALAFLVRASNVEKNIGVIQPIQGSEARDRAESSADFAGGLNGGNHARNPSSSVNLQASPSSANHAGDSNFAVTRQTSDSVTSTNSSPNVSSNATAVYAAAAAGSATAVSPAAVPAPAAAGAPKGGATEVDEDGFIIQKNRGFDDIKPAADFSSDEEGEEKAGPTIRVQISDTARPIASGDALRKSMIGLDLGLNSPANGKKKKKDKEKKKKRKDGIDEETKADEDEDTPSTTNLASTDSALQPLPIQSNQPATTVDHAVGMDLSLFASAAPTTSNNTSSANEKTTASASSTSSSASNPDDLFAFLDSQSSAPPPPLGQAPPSTTPSTSSSTVPTSLVSTSSSKSSGSTDPCVDVHIVETVHARIINGNVLEYAVWGEVILVPTAATVQSVEKNGPLKFDFQLFNFQNMQKITPNNQLLEIVDSREGIYSAIIPPGLGDNLSLCVMKYKVVTDINRAKEQLPLGVSVSWACQEDKTNIDLVYASAPTYTLNDVKFLFTFQPAGVIASCTSATPKCLWYQQSQKMIWQLPQLPCPGPDGKLLNAGKCVAQLANQNHQAATPTPLAVSFAANVDTVVSGVLLTEADGKDSHMASLGKVHYKIKSGIFTVI